MRRIGKTSALVESGILAAVAVLFTLVGNYIPVLDMVVNVLWPLPIILCGRRNGLKWSILCLVVTGCVVAVLLSPFQALTQCLILGLIGLLMGYGMRKQLSPVKILLLGSLGALISTILSGIAAYVFMDVNVIQVFFSSIDESLDMSSGIFQTLGMNMGQEQLAQMKKMFELVLPAGVLLSAPITAFANYWAARKILARLGDYYDGFPPISQWVFPKWILLFYGAGLVMMIYFGRNNDGSVIYRAGYTVFTMVSMVLLLQGLCVVRWYVEYRQYPRFLIPLSLLLTFTIPIASQFIVVIGAYDMVCDLRKLRHRKPAGE